MRLACLTLRVRPRTSTPFSVMQEWADLGFAVTRVALRAQLGPTTDLAMRNNHC
jgi:hypothetical protein